MNKTKFLIKYRLPFFFHLSSLASELKIGKIEFSGNERTEESTLNTAIKIKSGDVFTEGKLENAIQYLKNTTVFSKVSSEKTIDSQNKDVVNLNFKVEEKWTILASPIADSSGGSSSYGLFLLDTNFLGRLYNLGFTFKMINNKPNAAVKFENQHTFDLPLITQVTVEHEDQKKILYSQEKEIGFYSIKMLTVNPFFLWKFNDYVQLGSGLLFQKTEDINDQLNQGEQAKNAQNNIQSPHSINSVAYQMLGRFGLMNYHGLTQDGITLTSITNTTAGMYANSNNEEDYTSTENTLLAFYRPPFDKDSNLAFRLSQKSTSSNNPIRQVLIGSEQVRGFMASQFLGKFAVSSNVEYRYTAYSGENIGIQIVPFFDSGVIGGSEEDSFKRQMLSSYGIGLRIPLTKINILNFRIDYARTISPFITEDFAFNLTHFF